jgi:hypothetical protein
MWKLTVDPEKAPNEPELIVKVIQPRKQLNLMTFYL